jgi:hypothetical protein
MWYVMMIFIFYDFDEVEIIFREQEREETKYLLHIIYVEEAN